MGEERAPHAHLTLLAVALLWNWDSVALLLGAGFLGILRPHEIRQLRYADFQTPTLLMSTRATLFITVRAPKMRRITAKRAYTRIDELGFVRFADAFIGEAPLEGFIFGGSYAHFRLVFRALLQELRLPVDGPLALSWGSCRPGGATWLLRAADDPELVRFRGRWASSRMLEVYVQEVGAVSLLPLLGAEVRERVAALAAAAPYLLADAALRLRTRTGP